MRTTLLSHRDLVLLVQRVGLDRLMDELIERLTASLTDYTDSGFEIPARAGFHYEEPATGLIEWMPLMKRGDIVLMKIVGYHPHSPATQQIPTILSTFGQFDTTTGKLLALADGTFMTALRTGAASAVASRFLARRDSSVLGLIGCGAQAVTQLHALSRVFDLSRVLMYDVDAMAMRSLPSRVAGFIPPGLEIRGVACEEILASSDILCTATSVEVGEGPVFEDGPSRQWLHLNAVGSDLPGKVEVPAQVLRRSLVCPDFPAQAKCEGECQQLAADEIGPELCDVVKNPDQYEPWRAKPTVFDSTGWALEDHVTMELILDHARAFSLGEKVQITNIGDDPRDPYEFLKERAGAATGDERELA